MNLTRRDLIASLMKKMRAGMTQAMTIMVMTLPPVRHALYLAAILTEQKRSTVMRMTVNWETRQTV